MKSALTALIAFCVSLIISLPGFAAEDKKNPDTLSIKWLPLPQLPVPCAGQGVVMQKDFIWYFGGTTWRDGKKIYLSDAWATRKGDARWQAQSPLPEGLANFSCGIFGDKIYIVGGSNGAKTLSSMLMLDISAKKTVWQKLDCDLPVKSYYSSSIVMDGKLYVFGGLSEDSVWSSATNLLFEIDLKSEKKTWKALTPLPGQPRALSGICESGGSLYIFGGACSSGILNRAVDNLCDVWKYEPDTNKWTRLPDMPYPCRCGLAMPYKDKIIFMPGCITLADGEDYITDSVYVLSPVSGSWKLLTPAPQKAIAAGAIANGTGCILGGEDKPRHRINQAFMIEINHTLIP